MAVFSMECGSGKVSQVRGTLKIVEFLKDVPFFKTPYSTQIKTSKVFRNTHLSTAPSNTSNALAAILSVCSFFNSGSMPTKFQVD